MHHITIRGLVGDVAVYLPYDLDVSVVASAPVGAVNVMGARAFTTAGYAEAASKVRIAVSLAAGDIDVRYL